jgi:hypothetical protein
MIWWGKKMKYKCIKEMEVLILDENDINSETYETVFVDSVWELNDNLYQQFGEIHLKRIYEAQAFEINITEMDLGNYFELVN